MKKFFLFLMAATLLTTTAFADTSFSGTVVSAGSISILTPADGTLASVNVQAGDHVAAGETIAELLTTTIYAEEAGTVRVYGSEGAALADISEQYGAVMYLLPDVVYTLSASTRNAYDAEENRRVLPGESVYLRSSADTSQSGTGIVTGVDGSDYLVDVTSGEFDDGESVFIYRESDYAYSSRIGKGSITYTGTVGYTGIDDESTQKSLVKLLVEDGQHIVPGTPLFTVSTAEAYQQTMTAPESGIVATVNTAAGSAVTLGASVAEIYPDSEMRLALSVSEEDLGKISLGSQATITFVSGETAHGTVESLQGHAEEADEEEDDDETFFTVYVAFTPTDTIAYGMTGSVSIAE